MIGVSLPLDWLADQQADTKAILLFLKEHGVGSIELRTVRPYHAPQVALQAARLAWENGFQITVHGSVSALKSAVADVFAPLQALLPVLQQEKLNITIHPIVGDNAAMLTALSDHILENKLPVTISLENNRLLPDKTQGDSTKLVLEAVKTANRDNVGICFDMGHYAYYVKKNHPDAPDLLPEEEFWKYVTHTHIHAMNELRTHFPLDGNELPLARFLDKLSCGYFGVYNLELDFPRILPQWEPLPALANSIPYLQKQLHHCSKLYDQIREHFDDWFRSALRCWEEPSHGTTFSLLHSSSYFFCTGSCKWAVDIAFRCAFNLAKTPWKAADLLADMDVMLLSHGHRDHFEEATLCMLKGSKTLLVIPDFLEERVVKLGFSPEQLRIARPGEALDICGLHILPFVSSHFRPNGKGVQEYGYHITAQGSPSIVLPVDIRDFSKKADIPPADYCFANIWLEDDSADPASWKPLVESFCQYMLRFSAKNILLTHLYENGRPDDKMWRMEHAEAVAQQFSVLSPVTRVLIPQPGEILKLT